MSMASSIESFWYSKSWLKWLFLPLSIPFLIIVWLKRQGYQLGIFPSNQFKVPVLVVGNLTVGGTGKTPFISYLASKLSQQGIRIGVVSRGYLSKAPAYPHLVTESDSVSDVGDEAFMLFNQLALPMVIDANRSRAVTRLTEQFELDLIISDDGLQHYKMGRRFECLLVDSTREFGNGLCLPFGPLREPVSRKHSVDFVIQNGGEDFVSSIADIRGPKIIMKIVTRGLIHIKSGEKVSLSNLKERRINAVCGIGNPSRFFHSLATLCKEINPIVFADHYAYAEKDFEDLSDDIIVMTEKDAVKCRSFAKDNWYYLQVGASIEAKWAQQLTQTVINHLKLKQNL